MTLPIPLTKDQELFLSHVKEVPPPLNMNLQSPCWEWQASCAGASNGNEKRPQFNLSQSGKQINTTAARWAFKLFRPTESLKNNQHACHLCDNPMCVNPDHLYAGSVRDNMLDKRSQDNQPGADIVATLNAAVELSSNNVGKEDIAQKLNLPLWEVDRLLAFHESYSPYHQEYTTTYGQEAANSLLRVNLIDDYNVMRSVVELNNLSRHIYQFELNV